MGRGAKNFLKSFCSFANRECAESGILRGERDMGKRGISMAEKKREKVKQAIALEYDPNDEAPRVIASGRGALAERIIEKAKEADVPIHRDDKLADTLSRLEIGDMIPPELYEVVAEILIFVDSMDKVKAKLAQGTRG